MAALAMILLSASVASAQAKLPDGAVARLGVHRLRVPHLILDSAFTPDGRTFIVVQNERSEPNVILFDVATGMERMRLPIVGAGRIGVARQKPLLVSGSQKGIQVWDLAQEKPIKHWPIPKGMYAHYPLLISPDGAQAAAVTTTEKRAVSVVRWDVATGAALPAIEPGVNELTDITYSADSSKLITLHTPLQNLPSKDGRTLPGMVITWDAQTGRKLAGVEIVGDGVLSPGGSCFAQTDGVKKITIVDLDDRKTQDAFEGRHQRFALAPDGKQLLVLADEEVWLVDIGQQKAARKLEGKSWFHSKEPRFAQDGRLVAVIQNDGWPEAAHYFQFWDANTGKQVGFSSGHAGAVNALAYAPDGRTLATISKDLIHLFDPISGAERRRWVAHAARVEHIAFTHDGALLASGSADGTVAVWDPATGKLKKRLDAKGPVNSLAFARDGKTLNALIRNQALQTWDVGTGTLLRTHAMPFKLELPRFSPLGQRLVYLNVNGEDLRLDASLAWLTLANGKGLSPIDLRLNKAADTVDRQEDTYTSQVAFSADGKLLVTSDSRRTFEGRLDLSNHTIRVWESASRREILRFNDIPVNTQLLAVSPDSLILAHGVGENAVWGFGSDKAIVLRDISTAKGDKPRDFSKAKQPPTPASQKLPVSQPIDAHQGRPTCVAFSPCGKFLATGGADQVVYVWRVEHFLKRVDPPVLKGDVAALWPLLADADAGKAYQTIAKLATRPKDAIALVRQHIRPAPPGADAMIRQHFRGLSSDSFAVRQQAFAAIETAGEQAAHLLREALKDPQGLEVRRRVEALLDKVDRPLEDPQQLRIYRALTLLERIGTKEARALLDELAQGAPGAWLTIEAQQSLEPMRRKE